MTDDSWRNAEERLRQAGEWRRVWEGGTAMGNEPTREEILRGALADIAFSEDMTLEAARGKAARIYLEMEKRGRVQPPAPEPLTELRVYAIWEKASHLSQRFDNLVRLSDAQVIVRAVLDAVAALAAQEAHPARPQHVIDHEPGGIFHVPSALAEWQAGEAQPAPALVDAAAANRKIIRALAARGAHPPMVFAGDPGNPWKLAGASVYQCPRCATSMEVDDSAKPSGVQPAPSAEQQARDMLTRMGVEDAQRFSAGDLVELANLIASRGAGEAQPAALCARCGKPASEHPGPRGREHPFQAAQPAAAPPDLMNEWAENVEIGRRLTAAHPAAAQEPLIDAAEKYAQAYDGDDRVDIKTDVLNAFYAGAALTQSRREPETGD